MKRPIKLTERQVAWLAGIGFVIFWVWAACAAAMFFMPSLLEDYQTVRKLVVLLPALVILGGIVGVAVFVLAMMYFVAKDNVLEENPNATRKHALLKYTKYLGVLAMFFALSQLFSEMGLNGRSEDGGPSEVSYELGAIATIAICVTYHKLVTMLNQPLQKPEPSKKRNDKDSAA